jgi:hypothetical protein
MGDISFKKWDVWVRFLLAVALYLTFRMEQHKQIPPPLNLSIFCKSYWFYLLLLRKKLLL